MLQGVEMLNITDKIILRTMCGDYRRGNLAAWTDYEGQTTSEIKRRMRYEIRQIMRRIRVEKK
jgi:hypothetical protein